MWKARGGLPLREQLCLLLGLALSLALFVLQAHIADIRNEDVKGATRQLNISQPVVILPHRLYQKQECEKASMQHEHERAIAELQAEMNKAQPAEGGPESAEHEKQALHKAQAQALVRLAGAHQLQHMVLMQRLRTQQDVQGSSEASKGTLDGSKALARVSKALQDKSKVAQDGEASDEESAIPTNHVCAVIRTTDTDGPSHSHGSHEPGHLRRFLESMELSGAGAWQAVVVMVEPSRAIEKVVQQLKDERITIHQATVDVLNAHMLPLNAKDYRNLELNTLEEAIRACSNHTRWVVITHAHHAYDPAFWQEIVAAPSYTSILAFDYYSHTYRKTARQCARFNVSTEPAPEGPCKANLLRQGHTDLAAVALDWQRWMTDGIKYTMPGLLSEQDRHEAQLLQHVVSLGWEVQWVGPGTRCLMASGLSPQLCAMQGGVWDDTSKDTADGPRCLSHKEARRRITTTPAKAMVDIQLMYDPTSFELSNVSSPVSWRMWHRPDPTAALQCIQLLQDPPATKGSKHPTREAIEQCDLVDLPSAQLAKATKQLDAMFAPVVAIQVSVWHEETAKPAAHSTTFIPVLIIGTFMMLGGFLTHRRYKPRSKAGHCVAV